ncbi:DgyrCDS1485 [Dimorphilus gyrociliatus]|uniref:DgyrCDS1485 n=1 Tax=Dimorphilus gyrociliatus TaxID=2664684 RepID=A0A7I8VAC7_9ANNE|nr:DgyrCDS1485 [Dimorphilus gyrociliatus]
MYKKKSGNSALERANNLLKSSGARGNNLRKPSALDDDDDDAALDSYLKSLKNEPKKTTQESEISGLSDISISESEKFNIPQPMTNKFLKKKPASDTNKNTSLSSGQNAKKPIAGNLKSYSALSTLQKFSQKYGKSKVSTGDQSQRKQKISDTDSDIDISEDSEVLRDMKELKASKQKIKENLTQPSQHSFFVDSPSGFKDDISSSSSDFGKGAKFLKKKPAVIESPKTTQKKFIKTEIPTAKPEPKKKRSLFELESAKKHQTAVMLDTDEESMAAYLNELSSSRGPKSLKSASSSQAIDSIREDYDEAESIDSNDSFRGKIVDLAELDYEEPEQDWPGNRIEKTKKSEKKRQNKPERDVFEKLNIQTIDDTDEIDEDIGFSPPLKGILTTPRTPRSKRNQRLSFTDISHRSRSPSPEIVLTARPDSVTEEIYTEDFDKSVTSIHTESEEENITSIQTETRSRSKRDSLGGYSDDFSDETFSRRRRNSSASDRSRSRSYTRSRSYSDDFTNTEDYSSDEDSTLRSRRRLSRSSSYESYSSHASSTLSYSSFITDRSSSRSPSPRLAKRPSKSLKTKSVKIQTGEIPGLLYHWNNGPSDYSFLTGKSRLPTGTYHINPEKLEALTNHNPAEVLINSLVKQQLILAANMADLLKTRHRYAVENTQATYSYTTLAETKKYIASKRKKRLTYEEALREVKEEMGLDLKTEESECSKCQRRRRNSKSTEKRDRKQKSRKKSKRDYIDKIQKEIEQNYDNNKMDFSKLIQEKLDKVDPIENSKSNSLEQLRTVSSEGFLMEKSQEATTQSRVIVQSNGSSKGGISIQKIHSEQDETNQKKEVEDKTISEDFVVSEASKSESDVKIESDGIKESESESPERKSTTTDEEQKENSSTSMNTTESSEDKFKNVNFEFDMDNSDF